MVRQGSLSRGLAAVLLVLFALPAAAQSFRVQCPTSTITHPNAAIHTGAGLHRPDDVGAGRERVLAPSAR